MWDEDVMVMGKVNGAGWGMGHEENIRIESGKRTLW